MVTHAFFELLKQFFKDPVTNRFPVTHTPHNMHQTLKAVEAGKAQLNPPVPIPPNYRGKIKYDRDACIGCQMCIKVCPSQTIEFIPDDRKVLFYMSRCTFCQMCVDICPKDCIRMTDQFIMANLDKYGDDMIVKDSGPFVEQEKKEADRNESVDSSNLQDSDLEEAAAEEETEDKEAPAPKKKPSGPAKKGKPSDKRPGRRAPAKKGKASDGKPVRRAPPKRDPPKGKRGVKRAPPRKRR